MSTALVTLVIPVYNAAGFIAETLESVLRQDHPHFEVVLVDDGSTDDLMAAIAPFLSRIRVERQSNSGLAAARNRGMALARGDFIAWVDADDICERSRLSMQAAYLEHALDVVAVASNFAAFRGNDVFDQSHAASYYSQLEPPRGLETIFPESEAFDGADIPWLRCTVEPPVVVYRGDVWSELIFGNFMHPPTMMLRRDARERVGWLKRDIPKAEDWEFTTRLARLGPVAFMDAPLLRYRIHDAQMSRQRSGSSARSNIRVLESTIAALDERVPELRGRLRLALGGFHQEAAYELAELDRTAALKHLLSAVRLDPRGARIAYHLGRIGLAGAGLQLLRRAREWTPRVFRGAKRTR